MPFSSDTHHIKTFGTVYAYDGDIEQAIDVDGGSLTLRSNGTDLFIV